MAIVLSLLLILGTPAWNYKTSKVEFRGVNTPIEVYDLDHSLVGAALKESHGLLVESRWLSHEVSQLAQGTLSPFKKPVVVPSWKRSHPLEAVEKRVLWARVQKPSHELKRSQTVRPKAPRLTSQMKSFKNEKPPLLKQSKVPKTPQELELRHEHEVKKIQQHFILSGVVDWPRWLSKKDSLISVRREFEGVIKEEVLLSSHHLRYDLKIQETLGDLVVEVFHSSGRVLARGKQKLLSPRTRLTLKPVLGAQGFVHSHVKKPVKVSTWPFSHEFSYIKTSQEFHFPDFQTGSSYFMVAEAQNSPWSFLDFNLAGEYNHSEVFSDEFLSALLGQVLESQNIEDFSELSLVWGRVMDQGVPEEGVRVEMGGSQSEPIYFNGFLPDPERKTTSSNGLFVFITDEQGWCPIRGVQGDRIFSAQTALCQKGVVSLASLAHRKSLSIGVKAYDPFTNTPKKAHIEFLGENKEVITQWNSEVFLSLPLGSGRRMLSAKTTSDYEVTHLDLSQKSFRIKVPLISKKWLNFVFKKSKRTLSSHEGIVVGFIGSGGDQNLEIFLDGTRYEEQIVFFNEKGQVVSRTSQDKKGFVIFNMSLGFHNISLFFPERPQPLFNHVLFVERQGVNVIVL